MTELESSAESLPPMRGVEPPSRSQASLTLEKGIRILDCFDAEHPEWNLKDICACTGLARPTVYRLVKTLIDANYLARDSRTSNYHLGTGLLKTAYLMFSHSEIIRAARPFMEELATKTNESTTLGVWRDKDALIVDVVLASRAFVPVVTIGQIVPGYSSVLGKLFLAFGPSDFRQAMLSDGMKKRTEHSVVDPAEVEEMLLQVKREGVAFSLQEWRIGMCAVGAPVFGPDGALLAGLAIVAPDERFGSEEMRRYAADATKYAATKTSERLGYYVPLR